MGAETSLISKEQWLSEARRLGLCRSGDFQLKSGQRSNYYWDLRSAIGHPNFLRQSVALLAAELQQRDWQFDRVAAVPYGALGLALGLAWELGKPAVIPRAESKQHGLAGELVGPWDTGDELLLVEDVLTTGGSLLQVHQRLQALGLKANKAVCLLVRDPTASTNLHTAGVQLATLVQES